MLSATPMGVESLAIPIDIRAWRAVMESQTTGAMDAHVASASEILDNSDSAYSEAGSWANGGLAGAYGGGYRYANPGASGASAAWGFGGLASGTYELQASWTSHPNRTANARYAASGVGGVSLGSFVANQRVASTGRTDESGHAFAALGKVSVGPDGVLTVRLGSSSDGAVIADAVRLVAAEPSDNASPPPPPSSLVLDNSGSGYSEAGSWANGSLAGAYGGGYRYANPGASGASAAWGFGGLASGTYELQASWTSHPNRTANARYAASGVGGVSLGSFVANQRVASTGRTDESGHAFAALGKVSVGSDGVLTVRLGSSSDGAVIADAVRLVAAEPSDNASPPGDPPPVSRPNDPRFADQWGLNNANDVDINAPEAWSVAASAGLKTTVVAVLDTGVDYTHPDLYLNIYLNQGEIPAAARAGLVDTNADGSLDFYDLNSLDPSFMVVRDGAGNPINARWSSDINRNGRIDAGDLLADPAWEDGRDDDGDGRVDDLVGWDYYAMSNDPMDGYGHGTHVAGTIGAITGNGVGVAGVAPNARIIPMKIGPGPGVSGVLATLAIRDAATAGARVMNASWGSGSYAPGLNEAISYAADRGAVFVAAAGNYGSDNDATPFYPASIARSNVISVAAIDSAGRKAGFSNFGATTVDLGAPGEGILSTTRGGGYGWMSGTSMASPHVAGVVTLLAGLRPDLTPADLIDLVLSTAKPLASLAGRTVSGGIIDAYAAARAALVA